MRKIPPKLRENMQNDPFYKVCSLRGSEAHFGACGGCVTWEHAIIYAGRQLNEKWAIIPLCEKHHGVNNYQDVTAVNKEASLWVALNRASDLELRMVSKAINYQKEKERLNKKYGKYQIPVQRKHSK